MKVMSKLAFITLIDLIAMTLTGNTTAITKAIAKMVMLMTKITKMANFDTVKIIISPIIINYH